MAKCAMKYSMKNENNARCKIKKAARFLFKTKGYDATSLNDVAKAINIPEDMVAVLYGSKDDLLEAVWSE